MGVGGAGEQKKKRQKGEKKGRRKSEGAVANGDAPPSTFCNYLSENPFSCFSLSPLFVHYA